ncbi:Sel1 domain-containing [Chlorella sorokiniana]|uniref:Sel1 domain-containing n=1 Tax=Chlorella sorokiniana TaxID=3076 RepID=A0A2P6TMR3_CHLSO|nr:Sel1 domain-containing [Chlorella sorokiniana]|eukprot:PRW45605.1 Sel1 domain-containing [Chlorella sorokiniana]
MAAERLSSVRCRELLAACCVELLKASLVGSVPAAAASGGGSNESPEALLDALHASLQSSLQDVAHAIAPEHQEAWTESQWEGFQEAQAAVQQLLVTLHEKSAEAGSATAALQVARCREFGLLVPQDHAAAFKAYAAAAALGSAEGALRCGIHYFEGTAPGGRDGARAYDFLSQALELADSAATHASGDGSRSPAAPLPPLAPPSPETAVEGDVPPPLTPAEVRYSALTWTGRCYLEGAGVERSVAKASDCFQRAGNRAELQELAMLQRMFAEAQLPPAEPQG